MVTCEQTTETTTTTEKIFDKILLKLLCLINKNKVVGRKVEENKWLLKYNSSACWWLVVSIYIIVDVFFGLVHVTRFCDVHKTASYLHDTHPAIEYIAKQT